MQQFQNLQPIISDLWRLHPARMAHEVTKDTKTPFFRYPHIEKISQLIARSVFAGGARIILSTPPRHGKSWLTSLWTPAWFLSLWPHRRVILASYESSFAASWGRSVRNTLYQNPVLGVNVSDDSSAADRWATTLDGGMFTTGVGGPLTGKGADLLLLDDYVKNAQEANSEVTRQSTYEWWTSTVRTRLEPGASIIIVATRWHQDDLIGRITSPEDESSGKWLVINLPAICDSVDDWMGRKIGEALCPARYDVKALAEILEDVKLMTWSALYQGQPVPAGGALFNQSMFQTGEIPEKFDYQFVTADTAYTDKQESDYTVFSAWGVIKEQLYLINVWREQIKSNLVEEKAVAFIKRYSGYGFRGAYIEPKGHGIYLNQALPKRGILVPSDTDRKKFFEDRKLNKVERANNAVPHLANRFIVINEMLANKEALLAEALSFPKGRHDDFVDTLVDAVKMTYARSYSMFDVI